MKVPNWTSFLKDNGTTPVLSPPPQDKSSSSSHTPGVSTLPQSGLVSTIGQNFTSAADSVGSTAGWGAAQQGTKPIPADPTQSQAGIMLSQAGLPTDSTDSAKSGTASSQDLNSKGSDLSHTELGQSQAGTSQTLGLPDDLKQSAQTGVRSMAEGLPDDWDWEGYLQLNPDVAAAVGNDPDSAGLHWREWGQLEKRSYKVLPRPPSRPPFLIM